MRLRNKHKTLFAPYFFMPYQWNGIWGLQNRAIASAISF
jgi:hypothetical protein